VASIATGRVVRTIPCELEVEDLVAPGGPLRNPVGMIVDDTNGRLVVCDSDFSFMTPPSIDVLELSTGALVATHEFDSVGFCNDLALDGDGNVYATDSAGARVLRVQAADMEMDTMAETWATDPDFVVGMGEFGLNGIAYDDDTSLYVVNFQQGELHRITIEGNGDAGTITPITVDTGPLANPDGMKWTGNGELLVIEGGLAALSRVTLNGDTASTVVLTDGFDVPTTFALIEGSAWVAEGQLDHFTGADRNPPEPPFVVTRVELQ
jgi:sugar lactone lactonase YvrE